MNRRCDEAASLRCLVAACVCGVLLGFLLGRWTAPCDGGGATSSALDLPDWVPPLAAHHEARPAPNLKDFMHPALQDELDRHQLRQSLHAAKRQVQLPAHLSDEAAADSWQDFLNSFDGATGDSEANSPRRFGDESAEAFGPLLIKLEYQTKELFDMFQPLFFSGDLDAQLQSVRPLIQAALTPLDAAHQQVLRQAQRVAIDFRSRVNTGSGAKLSLTHWVQMFLDDNARRAPGDHRLAVIVPVRDRDLQIERFKAIMPGFLQRQQRSFRIFFVEQSNDGRQFNRAKLLNVGYRLAGPEFDYFAFHDVDMLPLFDTVEYAFPVVPVHLATCVEQFDWRMPYPSYLGGVTLISRHHMRIINGLSNRYWGWGGEDDDFSLRLDHVGLGVHRHTPHCERGIFHSISEGHSERVIDVERFTKLDYAQAIMWIDGLNSLSFSVLSTEHDQHWSRILVHL